MSVEYWNKERREWRPSDTFSTQEDVDHLNRLVGWEMYRKAE